MFFGSFNKTVDMSGCEDPLDYTFSSQQASEVVPLGNNTDK